MIMIIIIIYFMLHVKLSEMSAPFFSVMSSWYFLVLAILRLDWCLVLFKPKHFSIKIRIF